MSLNVNEKKNINPSLIQLFHANRYGDLMVSMLIELIYLCAFLGCPKNCIQI